MAFLEGVVSGGGSVAVLKKIHCPNRACGHAYMIDTANLGRMARCRHCGSRFMATLGADGSIHFAETVGDDDPPTAAERGIKIESGRAATPPEMDVLADVAADDTTRADEPPTSPPSRTASPKDRAERLPTNIGRFEVVRCLGSGGFGHVYEAFDPHLERKVALKVPRAATMAKSKARARFLREPKAAASLRHPNIVPVYDSGVDGERYFIAWAYIKGRTLQDVIRNDPPGIRSSVELVRRLAEGLHHAHQRGVIHRDVKPSNIMIDESGEPLLMDFGLAHLESADVKLTGDGAVLGTPAYISPEQVDRSFGEVGPHSDQYSLGVLLFQLLTGERPYRGSLADVLNQVLHAPCVSPRGVRPRVPRDLDAIVLKTMCKSPAERYPNCGALAEDLRRWSTGESILIRHAPPHERWLRWVRRSPWTAIPTALIVVTLMAGLMATTWKWQQAEAARRRAVEQIQDTHATSIAR